MTRLPSGDVVLAATDTEHARERHERAARAGPLSR